MVTGNHEPLAPSWRRTTIIGREAPVEGVELVARPGTCAGCRRAFRDHADAELQACAALYEPTQPSEPGEEGKPAL